MTSSARAHVALPLRTSMKNPSRRSYYFAGFTGAWLIFQGCSELGIGPLPLGYVHGSDRIVAWITVAFGVLALSGMVWAAFARRRVELSFDDAGIAQVSRPTWSARYEDLQVVNLKPTGALVRLALLELPDARARRRLPRWRRAYGLPSQTLASSFPASDEAAVRALLAERGIVPREFLAIDYHDDVPAPPASGS